MFNKMFLLIALASMLSYAGWEKIESNTTEWLTDVFFVDEVFGFTVGTNSTILKTTDGGDHWTDISINKSEWLTSVYFLNKNKGFIVGTNSIVITTENGGESWEYKYLPYQANFHEVFFIDEMNGWITGGTIYGSSVILKTTDGGNNWLPILNGFGLEFLGLKFRSINSGCIVGRVGTFLKSGDGGYNWLLNVVSSTELEDVTFAGEDIWITGDHGTLLKSSNDGQTWRTFQKVSKDHLFKARFIDNNYGIIVGGYGSGYYSESSIIMETKDGGENWELTQSKSWPKLYSVSVPSKQRAYAVGFNGTILRYDPNIITEVNKEEIPTDFVLNQNYPNPFNPTTIISYKLPNRSNVSLKVFDVLGKEVADLVNQEINAGTHEVKFDGSKLPSGIYFYTLRSGNYVDTKKLILIK